MKTAEKNTSSTASHQIQMKQQPFFNKDGESSFFSDTKAEVQAKPFFNIPDRNIIENSRNENDIETYASENVNTDFSNATNGSPSIQAKCNECEAEEKEGEIQRKEETSEKLTEEEPEIQTKPIFESNVVEENIQTKSAGGLTVGKPNDKYEVEADAMADQVVQKLAEPTQVKEEDENPEMQTVPELQSKAELSEVNTEVTTDSKSVNESKVQLSPVPVINIAPVTSTISLIQQKCETCENEEKEQVEEQPELQKKSISGGATDPSDDENPNIQRRQLEMEATEYPVMFKKMPNLQLSSSSGGSESSIREKIVKEAQKMVGKIEARKDDGSGRRVGAEHLLEIFHLAAKDAWPDEVIENVKYGPELPHWCGIFSVYSIKKAGIDLGYWQPGRGVGETLQATDNPQPGDIGYFHEKQHHCIIKAVNGDTIDSIDGNSANFSEVVEKTRPKSAFTGGFMTAFTGSEKYVQKKEESSVSQPSVNNSLQDKLSSKAGKGSSIDDTTKSQMESGFGADFSNVNIHTDSQAVEMNKSLGAQAFTHGNDIYFNQGKYDTNSSSGKHLLAHELTHTIQQEGSGKSVQKRPEDYLHTEDGNQSMDGINEEVTDELGEEKNIRNPQISNEERSESPPPVSEKGDGVDEGALRESAKPVVDRKEETQPQIQESLEKVNEELNETNEEPAPEEESISGEVEKLSPKEQAIVKSRTAYQKAKRSPKRQTPKSVRIPEFKRPKDAQGNEVQGNAEAEAKLIEQTVKIEVLRQQAAQLKEGADQERINAAQIEGDLQMMYYGVYTSDEVVDKATQHKEIRKEGVGQSKGHLAESQQRVRQVQEGLPEVLENATEGRQESEPMADSSSERKQANDNINAQDEDARQEAEERGGELESSNNDAQNIDNAVEQTHQRATTMTEQVVVAVEQNTESEAEIAAMDLVLLDIENKLGQTTAQNETAKSSLAIHDNASQIHEEKANQLDAAADAKLKRSDELEQNIHTVYDGYHNKMASIQPDPANLIVQTKPESGVPNIQLQPDTNPPISPEQQQREQTNTWFAEQVEQMDREVMTEFDEMNFLEKGWFGLKRTFLDIGASLSRVNWGAFTEELLLSLVDPVFLVESMGQLFNAVINPQHRENEDPLTYLLREAAGLVTAIAITFGTIAGLCLIGMGVLAVVNFWFPPTLFWSPPIYAELGALMSWSGAMLWATTKIALVLHALVFISDLIATAFSSSAQQLIDNSKQMRTDVDTAAFPIITAGTFGLFEILAVAGRRLGIIRPRTGTSEAPRTTEEARPTEEGRIDEPSQTTEPTETPTDSPEQPVRDGESNNPAENMGDEASRPNVEGANTVDGLEVTSEFRGDDGHTRKVLEDGQFARCTICTRCRERFPNQLQNPTLLGYLEQLEARFRANPNDATVQSDSLAFERDLDAVRSGGESIDTVAERYGSTAGDEAMAASGAIEIPSSWDVFMTNLHDVFRRRLFRFRGTNDLTPTPNFQGGEGALFLSERNPMRTLKRWYESQIGRIVRSVNRLRAARNVVNSSEYLSSRMEVVQVYEQGGDWIVRDFDRSTVPLSSAIRSDRVAATILAEVRNFLTQMTDEISSGARRRRVEAHEAGQRDFTGESFYTPEESSNLSAIRDIQSKIRGETVSDNLHWSDSKGKIIIIDME